MVAVFGASGHAREVAFILRSSGKKVNFFVTKEADQGTMHGARVLNEPQFFEAAQQAKDQVEVFIAVGNCHIRKRILTNIREVNQHIVFPNLFYGHKEPDLADRGICLGEGNVFFPGVVLTVDIWIGSHNHFNSNSSISHDCKIGDFNTVSPGVNIAGNVTIGQLNFIGMNAALIPNIRLGDNLLIGAGATITGPIDASGTYVGTPARKIK